MVDPARIVKGIGLDAQTRCIHYHSALDVVAIRMACCRTYYACKDCHEALADHSLRAWPREQRHEPAVLCGACGREMTVSQYLASDSTCPNCGAAFNPACRNHHRFYFSDAFNG